MIDRNTKSLPGSGTIKLSQIKTEFGKGNNLLSYLGAGGVTSSAPIKLTDFYGKSDTPPLPGAGAGYFDGTKAKVSLGICYPKGWAGGTAYGVSGWKASKALYGDFANYFESMIIGDVDEYGTAEWMILVYKPGQHSKMGGKTRMTIKQDGRPTTKLQLFDNTGIYGNSLASTSGRLAVFSQMTGHDPEGQMGPSVRENYVWNHTGYAFPNLDSKGNQNDVTVEVTATRIGEAADGLAEKLKPKGGHLHHS
jgi:hypothetical protein